MAAVDRFVTTGKKPTHRDPRDETGRKLSQLARIRRLEATSREFEAIQAKLMRQVHDLGDRVQELQDILVDFCAATVDRSLGNVERAESSTRMVRRISALTEEHGRRDSRRFEPDDAPVL